MIKQHPTFIKIPEDTILWHYMFLPKFLYLIKNSKLHLHRIDDLMDKEEGVLSFLDKRSLHFYKDTEGLDNYMKLERQRNFVSCWIKYPIEQSLMWYSYGKDGVAIRTTASRIIKAMECDREHNIYMIGVKYINKKMEAAHMYGEPINVLKFSTTKRNQFELENEVRLLFSDGDRKYQNVKGFDVDIDISALIGAIVVSSTVDNYVYDLICKEVEDAGIEVKPTISEL